MIPNKQNNHLPLASSTCLLQSMHELSADILYKYLRFQKRMWNTGGKEKYHIENICIYIFLTE